MQCIDWATLARAGVTGLAAATLLSGCETMGTSFGKRIEYKTVTTAPALEIPPDLTTPQYDDRYAVATASALAAQNASRPKAGDQIAPNTAGEARVARSGNERWLVVKTSPENAWGTVRQFWIDTGFVLAVEQPGSGIMETDWAENRGDLPRDAIQRTLGKVGDFFVTTYRQDKFRTRIERGTEAGTVEIFVSSRRMEQMPTGKIDNSSPSGFRWMVVPSDPLVEAEFLQRLMVRFGTPEQQAVQAVNASAKAPDRAHVESATGVRQLVVDDNFDRAWRRVGLALDRIGFTVVDRDRSKGLYFVRYSDPDAPKTPTGDWLSKLMFWRDNTPKPEQYRIQVNESGAQSVVLVQDPNGVPEKSQNSEKILALLQEQLK
jgi:outer membrane protein assembly factor BamC